MKFFKNQVKLKKRKIGDGVLEYFNILRFSKGEEISKKEEKRMIR